MHSVSDIVFSNQRIATNSLIAKELDIGIDESNKLMYQFYLKNKENLNTIFLVMRKDGPHKIALDKVVESKLNNLLNDVEYAGNVLSVKVWAFYSKKHGELDIQVVYDAEEADVHCIQNLCQKMRDIDLKQSQAKLKRTNTALSQSSQKSKTAEKAKTMPLEKAKPDAKANDSQASVNKKPVLTEIQNHVTKPAKVEEAPKKEEEKKESKKRKGGTVDNLVKEMGKEKDLKKTKMTGASNDTEPKGIKQAFSRQPTLERKETNGSAIDTEPKGIKQDFSRQSTLERKETIGSNTDSAIEIEEENYYGGETQNPRRLQTQSSVSSFDSEPEFKFNKKGNEALVRKESFGKPKEVPISRGNSLVQEPTDLISNAFTNENGDNEETIKVKRVRKVPREKTYMDAKGYLIVEKEFVDEEYWEEVKKKNICSQNTSHQAAHDVQAGSKKKPAEKNQATLSSFFAKKK